MFYAVDFCLIDMWRKVFIKWSLHVQCWVH